MINSDYVLHSLSVISSRYALETTIKVKISYAVDQKYQTLKISGFLD